MRWTSRLRGWGIATGALAVSLSCAALAFGATSPHVTAAACNTPAGPNRVRCAAKIVRRRPTRPLVLKSAPQGYGPSQLQAAYGLTALAKTAPATTQTVAIVDAYNDTTLVSDLAAYRSHYGLPSCTTGSGCLKVVGETGTATLPRQTSGGTGWNLETSLDVDVVSAACPRCRILVVLANTASYVDLGTAENTAVRLGANVVSNSWGGADSSSDPVFDAAYFHHANVAIVAATGDAGFAAGPTYPSTSPYVTAVGGTTLAAAAGTARGYTETTWAGGGSGCSTFEAMPVWQQAVPAAVAACGTRRAAADVAADASPSTGVAVYDTSGEPGWFNGMLGGTSLATPLVGAVYALAGNTSAFTTSGAEYLYGQAGAAAPNLFDITSGTNGTCAVSLQCTAAIGWDGPTGLGSPDGIAGF